MEEITTINENLDYLSQLTITTKTPRVFQIENELYRISNQGKSKFKIEIFDKERNVGKYTIKDGSLVDIIGREDDKKLSMAFSQIGHEIIFQNRLRDLFTKHFGFEQLGDYSNKRENYKKKESLNEFAFEQLKEELTLSNSKFEKEINLLCPRDLMGKFDKKINLEDFLKNRRVTDRRYENFTFDEYLIQECVREKMNYSPSNKLTEEEKKKGTIASWSYRDGSEILIPISGNFDSWEKYNTVIMQGFAPVNQRLGWLSKKKWNMGSIL